MRVCVRTCARVHGCCVCNFVKHLQHKYAKSSEIFFFKQIHTIACSFTNNSYHTIIITKTYEMLLSNMSEEQRISSARVRIGCDFVVWVALFRALLLAGRNV